VREGSGYGHRSSSASSKAPLQGTEPFKSFAAWRASSEGKAAAAAATNPDEVDAKLKEGFEAYQTAYVATLTEALENEACDHDWFANRYDPTKRLAIRDAAMQRKASAAQRVAQAVRDAARQGEEETATAAPGKDGAPGGAAAGVASSLGPHRTGPPAPGADHAAALAGCLSAVPLAAAASLGCAKRDRRGDLEQPPPLQSLPGVQDAEAKGRLVTLRRIPPWCPREALLAALEAAARDPGGSDTEKEGDSKAAAEAPSGTEPATAAGATTAAESPPLVEQLFVSDASKGRGKAYHAAAWVLYSSVEAAARAAPRAGTAVAALAAGFAPPPGMGFSSSLVAAAGLAPVGKPLDGLEVRAHF